MKIKQSILSWIIFSGTSLFCYLWFAAYTNLPNQNSWDIMTSTIWNNTINKVNTIGTTYAPTWMVSAFYWTSCPSWWVLADGTWDEPKTDGTLWTLDLRWEFIRWLDSGRWIDTWRVLWSFQRWSHFQWYNNDDYIRMYKFNVSNIMWYDLPQLESTINISRSEINANIYNNNWYTTNWAWFYSVRPRNVALLYCIKQ